MAGSEQKLDVYLDTKIIANIELLGKDQIHWHYGSDWQKSGFPLSPHLPLQAAISAQDVMRFLRNLLPEGSALEELVQSYHLSKYNTFGLVRALGHDTSGALIILPSQEPLPSPSQTSFRLIREEELEQRLSERDEFKNLIIWDGKPRLSVAGVQDKINVVCNEKNELGFGEGYLCSTHILKFEKQKLPHWVINEYLSMQLAYYCGLQVAKVQLKRYGRHPALLVERFDRRFISIHEVKRRHIIDGCQALNLPPEHKYERIFGSGRDVKHIREGANLTKLFEFANLCENPALTKQKILDWTLFNVLIFNSDAHGKNISFYVDPQGLSLTPFYDLVNIKMYPQFEQELAMAMGAEFNGNSIFAYQLADFADSCQLSRTLVSNRLRRLIDKLQKALEMTAILGLEELDDEEQAYVDEYKKMVKKRCDHLLKEASGILSTIL